MDLAGMKRRELQALCKRHGLPAGGTNVAIVARLDAALSGAAAGAEEEEGVAGVPAAKGCLKQTGGDAAEAKKVTFAAEEGRARRRRTRVIWSPMADKAKTRGKSAQASTDSAAAAEDSVSAEVGANVPLRRSRRKSVVAVEAEEVGEAVAVDRKRKRKNQDNDESVAVTVSAQVGVSSRVTRRSSLAGVALVLPPAVEKKRGRGRAAGGSSKIAAEVQESESDDVRNSAQVEASARITRSRRSIAPVVVSPNVVENKRRRKTGDARANAELPTVSDVLRNEAPVTRSLRSRVVQVNNSMVAETHTASQLESKTQPSRPPTRRHQQVSSSVEEKNQEQTAPPKKAPILRRSGRNHSEDAEKQLEVKEAVKRSTRKSVALATLEKGENDLIEEKNPAAHVRRSTRKSIVPVKDIKGIGEKIHNANREDAVKQPATKGPVRGSRRKTVVPEFHEKEKDLIAEKNMEVHEGKSKRKPVMPVKNIKAVGEGIQNAKGKDVEKQFVVKQPTRRSSRKSVMPDMLEKNSGLVAAEMNAEKNRRSKQKSVKDIPNEKDNTGGRSSKRRRTTASEEMRSVKVGNDDIIIREATKDAHTAIHEYKESGSRVQESGQVNVTREEHSSGPLLVTQTLADKISTAQSVPVVILGSESGGDSNESSDKSKQEHSGIQAVDTHLSGTSAELDQSSCIAGPVLHIDVSEDKSLMGKDGLSIDFTVGDHDEQSPVSREGRPSLEANASEPGENDLANVMSTGLNAKSLQQDTDIIAKETDKDVLPLAFPIEEHGEKYTGSPIAVEKIVGWEASACLQHDCDVLAQETGEASGAAPPISEDTNPEIQCNAEESIQAADLGKCPSRGSIGNPYPTSLHLEGAAVDCILPVLNADKGCSSDGRPSSFGLELMFAEACKESFSKNTENTAVEIVDGNKHSTPVTPGFYVESVCLGDEDVQPSGCDADKNLNVDQGITGEEVSDQEKCNDQHIPAKTNVKMKLNDGMESDCSITEKNERFVADNLDQHVIIQVQQGDVQECDLEKPSLCSASRESKHECGLPEEYASVEIDGGNKPRAPLTPGFSVGSDCLEYEDMLPTECDADKKLDVDHSVIGEDIIDVTPGFYLRSDCLEDEDGQPTRCDADKKLDIDKGVIEEEVLAQEKSNDQHAPAKADLNMKINDELAGPGTESGCSITEKNTRLVVDNLDEQAVILVQQGDVEEATPLPEEIGGGNKHSTLITPDFYVGSNCLEDEDVQPAGFDADKKLDVDQGVTEEEVLVQQKSNDQHVPTKTDLNMKLNDELASPCMESGCSITEKNTRPFADNLDQQAIFQVQQGDVQEGDLKKTSPCSTTPECKHKYGLSEETVLLPKNTGSLSNVEQSPFGLESLFSQENIDESMGSAKVHTKNGFDDSKDRHVKSAVLKPYSLNDIVEGVSKNDDCMQTSQHDNGMEGLPEVLDGSYMEKSLDGSSTCGVKVVCRVDAIENPSVCLATTGYKHEDALSEEAAHTLKNYAGPCSSNPRELLMDLQSLFSKGNIKESHPDDGLAFPSAENSGDESISVEQCVKVHHGSNLSHLGSTDLLDELIGCSNTEVLHQSHNREDRSNMDRVEQVASEPCTNDIVEASAAAECIESGLVLLPSEERSNLNDGQLSPKLESPTNMGSGLNCDKYKYVFNTSANGSAVVVVGERTPSGSSLPEDYPKDHYPRQEILDGCSVESSLQGTICRKKIVSAVAGIGSPSSLATHDYKYEGALSKESVCRMKNYTAMSSVDPKHLIMEIQSPHSEGSTEKPDLQDNLAFPSVLNGRDEPVVCHVEELLAQHVSSEPDTCQRPCEDLSRHEEKESRMKGSLTSVQIDLADDAHLIERDIVAPVEVSCEEKVEIKCMPTSGSDILQEKSSSNGHGICQSHSQKHIVEANSRLSICGTGTEVLHQDHKEECNEPNEGKFSLKALVENNMSEDAPIEGIVLPLVAGTSEIPDEQLNTKMSDESEKLCFSSDKDTIENFCTGPAKGDLYSLPKDFHIDTCQKQEDPEVLSLPESAEESAKFQCVSVSGSGPCQQRVNESTSMQATYNIDETVNLDHEEYNQNNKDQTTPGVSANSVPEAVEIEIEQSEMEIGLIPAIETSVLPVPDEQPNSKLEGNGDQITPGIPTSSVPEAVEIEIEQSEIEMDLIPATETSVLLVPDEQPNSKLEGNEDQIIAGISASSVPEAVEIEQSEMEMGLIPTEETSVLPVPDEQPNSKLEDNEVDENSCSYGKDFFILSDSESLKREASSLNKDGCMGLSSEDHPNLPAPTSPEPSAYIQNDNESGSVGISQSSRQSGISELRAKLQSFKVSSTVKGSYIAMSAARPKPGDSMSQSAAAQLRNIENTPAVKAGHPVKPNANGKDSSRRALQPISGRPREY